MSLGIFQPFTTHRRQPDKLANNLFANTLPVIKRGVDISHIDGATTTSSAISYIPHQNAYIMLGQTSNFFSISYDNMSTWSKGNLTYANGVSFGEQNIGTSFVAAASNGSVSLLTTAGVFLDAGRGQYKQNTSANVTVLTSTNLRYTDFSNSVNRIVMLDTSNRVLYSSDLGITWSVGPTLWSNAVYFKAVKYFPAANTFVAYVAPYTVRGVTYTSSDGINWTQKVQTQFDANNYDITHPLHYGRLVYRSSDSLYYSFCTRGNYHDLYTSSDLTTWTFRNKTYMGTNTSIDMSISSSSLVYSPPINQFVALKYPISGNVIVLATSSNGTSWATTYDGSNTAANLVSIFTIQTLQQIPNSNNVSVSLYDGKSGYLKVVGDGGGTWTPIAISNTYPQSITRSSGSNTVIMNIAHTGYVECYANGQQTAFNPPSFSNVTTTVYSVDQYGQPVTYQYVTRVIDSWVHAASSSGTVAAITTSSLNRAIAAKPIGSSTWTKVVWPTPVSQVNQFNKDGLWIGAVYANIRYFKGINKFALYGYYRTNATSSTNSTTYYRPMLWLSSDGINYTRRDPYGATVADSWSVATGYTVSDADEFGGVLRVTMRYANTAGSGDGQYYHAFSSDEGVTWSSPQSFKTLYPSFFANLSLSTLSDYTYMVYTDSDVYSNTYFLRGYGYDMNTYTNMTRIVATSPSGSVLSTVDKTTSNSQVLPYISFSGASYAGEPLLNSITLNKTVSSANAEPHVRTHEIIPWYSTNNYGQTYTLAAVSDITGRMWPYAVNGYSQLVFQSNPQDGAYVVYANGQVRLL